MPRQLRTIMAVLSIILVLLIVATVSFSVESTRDAANQDTASADVQYRIQKADNGLYGLYDSNDEPILEPEWKKLSYLTETYICGKSTSNLYGILDTEGNLLIPAVYASFTEQGGFYVAAIPDTTQVVVYDSAFQPLEEQQWDSWQAETGGITVYTGTDGFTYSNAEQPMLVNLSMRRVGMQLAFVDADAQETVGMLTAQQWQDVADLAEQAIRAFCNQNIDIFSSISEKEQLSAIQSAATVAEDTKVRMQGTSIFLDGFSSKNGDTQIVFQTEVVLKDAEGEEQVKNLTLQVKHQTNGAISLHSFSLKDSE